MQCLLWAAGCHHIHLAASGSQLCGERTTAPSSAATPTPTNTKASRNGAAYHTMNQKQNTFPALVLKRRLASLFLIHRFSDASMKMKEKQITKGKYIYIYSSWYRKNAILKAVLQSKPISIKLQEI